MLIPGPEPINIRYAQAIYASQQNPDDQQLIKSVKIIESEFIYAAREGNVETVSRFLDVATDIEVSTHLASSGCYKRALFLACFNGQLKVLSFLLNDARCHYPLYGLQAAAENGQVNAIDMILNHPSTANEPIIDTRAVSYSVTFRHINALDRLLRDPRVTVDESNIKLIKTSFHDGKVEDIIFRFIYYRPQTKELIQKLYPEEYRNVMLSYKSKSTLDMGLGLKNIPADISYHICKQIPGFQLFTSFNGGYSVGCERRKNIINKRKATDYDISSEDGVNNNNNTPARPSNKKRK